MRSSSTELPPFPPIALADARVGLTETLILLGQIAPLLDPIETMQAKTAAYCLRQIARALLEREHDSRPLTDRERYAVAIWAWTRAHPGSTFQEFMTMLDRAERLARGGPFSGNGIEPFELPS